MEGTYTMKILAQGLEQMFGGTVRIHEPAPVKPYHLDLTSEEAEIVDCALCLAIKYGLDHVEREQIVKLQNAVIRTFERQDR